MNPFVNLQQRSIDLPAGCKDLMDVLLQSPPKPSPTPGYVVANGKPSSWKTGKLENIELYLGNLLSSSAVTQFLNVASPKGALGITLLLRKQAIEAVMVVNSNDTTCEGEVRAVFSVARISSNMDALLTATDKPVRVLRYPLPDQIAQAAKLICELLRRAYGVNENSKLWFYRHPLSI